MTAILDKENDDGSDDDEEEEEEKDETADSGRLYVRECK